MRFTNRKRISPRLWHLMLLILAWYGESARAVELQPGLTVNQHAFAKVALQAVYQVANADGKKIDATAFVNSLVDDRLLADYALKTLGADVLETNVAVGFPVSVWVTGQQVGIIQSVYGKELNAFRHANPQINIDKIVTFADATAVDQAKATLASVGMVYELSASAREQASGIVVGSFTLPGQAPRAVTLAELYDRQNVQGRIKLHESSADFMREQLVVLAGQELTLWWARNHSALGEKGVSDLQALVRARYYTQRLRAHLGVELDMHDDNPALQAAYERVSDQDIARYYREHKERFRRVEAVAARHIQLKDQETANKVFTKLLEGVSFDALAQQYSIAGDGKAEVPGQLPIIRHDDKTFVWLKSVVFALKQGQVSRPIRAPQANGDVFWEILLVDERVEGYYDEKSETVRYLAGKVIAQEAINTHYAQLKQGLRDAATIRIAENWYQ